MTLVTININRKVLLVPADSESNILTHAQMQINQFVDSRNLARMMPIIQPSASFSHPMGYTGSLLFWSLEILFQAKGWSSSGLNCGWTVAWMEGNRRFSFNVFTPHITLSTLFPSNFHDFHGYTYSVPFMPDCTVIVAAPSLGKVGFIQLLFQRNLTFLTVPTLTSASMNFV